jgi:hypothetical protein
VDAGERLDDDGRAAQESKKSKNTRLTL